jgi:glycosyltransferase involved in cell wall biosynthesis
MTIAVVATCVGKPFHQFSQGWIKAVLELERKPDEIVISTDLVKREIWLPDGVVRYVPVTQQSSSGHWAFAVNEAIAVTSSDWICKIDIDDLILPHALNEIDACEADVYCFGIKIREHDHYATQVNAEILLNQTDPQIYSNSPYRRWIWEAHPYEDMFYEDGVFWYAAAVEGATFAISPNIDYVYGIHENQTTKHVDHIKCIKDMNTRKEEMLSARARE